MERKFRNSRDIDNLLSRIKHLALHDSTEAFPGDNNGIANQGTEDLNLERLEKQLKVIHEISKLQLEEEESRHKYDIAKFLMYGSIVILGILIVLGYFKDDYEAPKLWWTFLGPLVGYLLRVLFVEGKAQYKKR